MPKPKILVVGATSTVGRHVIDQLARAGQVQPVAGVRSIGKAAPFLEQGLSVTDLDLADVGSIRRALKGIDRVFLLTGNTVDMVIQSKLVVDQAEAAGVAHIVHMGAWAPDDTDLGHFGWHQMIERYIQGSRLTWTHVAPGMFMQNMLGGGTLWGSFTKDEKSGSRAIHAFTGRGRLGWIAAEDIARVCVAALHDPGRHSSRKYNLSVEARSVEEVASILTEALGEPFHAETHKPETFYQALLASGMEPTYAAYARETLERFARNGIPGQEVTYPFEAIIGVAPIDWSAFAKLHRVEFLGPR